jgi:hypothetical protein
VSRAPITDPVVAAGMANAALASEPAQAEMPDGWNGWHVEHIDSSRDQLEQWILVGGVRPRIRIVITERDVAAGAVQALRVFADRIERGGKGEP